MRLLHIPEHMTVAVQETKLLKELLFNNKKPSKNSETRTSLQVKCSCVAQFCQQMSSSTTKMKVLLLLALLLVGMALSQTDSCSAGSCGTEEMRRGAVDRVLATVGCSDHACGKLYLNTLHLLCLV